MTPQPFAGQIPAGESIPNMRARPMATPQIPQSLTPEQADLWVAGYVVAHISQSIDRGDDFYRDVAPVLTDSLKLKRLGSGIEKTAYLLPSGRQVLKLQRFEGQSLTKEQRAMAIARERGLPVPEQHLLHDYVALSECCHAINTLWEQPEYSQADRDRIGQEYFKVSQAFGELGVGDRHEGNFGVRADGSVVCIDIGFGIVEPEPVSEPQPEPVSEPAPEEAEADRMEAERAALREADRAEQERIKKEIRDAIWAERARLARERDQAERAASALEAFRLANIRQAAHDAINAVSGLEDTAL